MVKSRKMKWAGHVARMQEKRNSYRILLGKPEGKRPLGRPKCRWADNAAFQILQVIISILLECINRS
jgi:hypothetical protein